MKRRPGFVGPLLLIAIGFILLFNKLGLIYWGSWGSLLHFWPVILILWGIEILARHTESDVVYFTAVFLSIVVIIGTVLLASNGYPPAENTKENMTWIIFNNRNFEDKDLNFVDLDGANMAGAQLNGTNHIFASTSKSTICPDSRNGP